MSVMTIERNQVFHKTARGRAEIGKRLAGLSGARRQLLIVIDGQKDIATVAKLFPGTDVRDDVHYLWRERFIDVPAAQAPPPAVDPAFGAFRKAIETPPQSGALVPPDLQPDLRPDLQPQAPAPAEVTAPDEEHTLAEARRFMTASARNNIGLLAERLIARIEAAGTRADLAAVASQWHMALRDSKRGKPVADALLEHVLGLFKEPTGTLEGGIGAGRAIPPSRAKSVGAKC